MIDVLSYTELKYFTLEEGRMSLHHDIFNISDLKHMMLDTRPTYPSDKRTFDQANITKGRVQLLFKWMI